MDEIFDAYYEKIYYWSIKKTNNIEDAKDLTNNIFVSIFEYVNKNIEIEKLDNLIWKIAHNLWNQKAKKYITEKNDISIDDGYNLGYNENIIDKIIYKEIVNNIETFDLTDKEIIAFKLYYYKDLSVREIGNEMNTSDSNVKYYLYSARNKIKERYCD